jgi:GMP synthase (glutamine-hydrolysing)
MKIHAIQHEAFEGLGAIATWADSNHHTVTITHCYKGEKVPSDIGDIDLLIVLGGPQSTKTTLKECPYFDAKQEIALIKNAIEKKKKVLGICLGAQLIGEAYGADVMRSPEREIGLFPITLTDAAKDDPFFSTLPQTINVAHWHGDMPGLSDDAVVLAKSAGCPRQIIRFNPEVYGFQCHFDFTQATVDKMLMHSADELKDAGVLPYVQDANTIRKTDYNEMNQILCKFLTYLTALDCSHDHHKKLGFNR